MYPLHSNIGYINMHGDSFLFQDKTILLSSIDKGGGRNNGESEWILYLRSL